MTRLVNLVLAVSALSLAACPSGGSSCEDDPDNCGGSTPDASHVTCGNHVCESSETSQSCPADCPVVPCGNGTCDANETHASCPADCPAGPVCGDNVCASTETAASCPADCASTFIADNLSGQVVYFLYAWRCGTTDKGADLLGAGTLQPNYHIQFDNVNIGCWMFEADALNHAIIDSFNSAHIVAQTPYTWNIY